MRNSIGITLALAALVVPLASMAQEKGPAKPPPPLLKEIVEGMPKGEKRRWCNKMTSIPAEPDFLTL